AARRFDQMADLHSQLGFRLARHVPLCEAIPPAKRDDAADGIYLRQLGSQSAESAAAAAARPVGAELARRNGRPLDTGGSALTPGSRCAARRIQTESVS